MVNLHQVDYAVEFSDRIIGLRRGKLVFDGTPDELDAKVISYIYGTPYVREHADGVEEGELVNQAPDRPGIVVNDAEAQAENGATAKKASSTSQSEVKKEESFTGAAL